MWINVVRCKITTWQWTNKKKEKITQVLIGFVYVFGMLPRSHVFKFLWYQCVWVFLLPILTLATTKKIPSKNVKIKFKKKRKKEKKNGVKTVLFDNNEATRKAKTCRGGEVGEVEMELFWFNDVRANTNTQNQIRTQLWKMRAYRA